MVLVRESSGEFRFASGVARVGVEANELDARYGLRARATVTLPALGDHQ
ncbi:MAG TPA: hypothetical protein VHN16_14455 [Streptosporangiaceae bacterium]|nr:hypothetical protein [Streptosporangiaceae bacterium]